MRDIELIHKINSWDDNYLNELLERHLQKIYQACFRVCLNESNANDITQNVVLKIIKNLSKFQNKSEFSTWYYRIAYNESITFLKKNKINIEFDELENVIIDETTDFYDSDNKQKKQDINVAIDSLPLLDRNIILYFYFDNIKIKEIAEILQLNENTVKTRLKRAKDKLQSHLQIYEDINKTV
jgi:RNA polymerase sigma-70 factor, ECF subfamily